MKTPENNLCWFCNIITGRLTHISTDYQYSTEIWDLLKHLIYQETGLIFNTDKKSLLHGF